MAYTAKKTNSLDVDPTDLGLKIKGWGADLDMVNRPGVPKEKVPRQGTGAHWIIPERQIPRVRIFKSLEHKELTPVFGTACPPKGLSGAIRNLAYKYSEGRMAHWFLLLFADRVDVAESMVRDLFAGRADNLISEMGLKAEWKRHGLRSRLGQNRADVWSRFPKELLLIGGIVGIVTIVRPMIARTQRARKAA